MIGGVNNLLLLLAACLSMIEYNEDLLRNEYHGKAVNN